MMLYLHGYPIIEWVFRRLKQSKLIDQIIFALPNTERDDVLELYLESIGSPVYRGSEKDLVDRFYKTAKSVSSDHVVRVCADNPLICASEIDRLIAFYEQEQCDYAYNHIPKANSYPDGLGAEICSMQLLEEIHQRAVTSEQREHLFNMIWDSQADYIIKTFDPPCELAYPDLKLDLDTMDDYKSLLEKPYRIDMSALEIVKTTLEHPVKPTI